MRFVIVKSISGNTEVAEVANVANLHVLLNVSLYICTFKWFPQLYIEFCVLVLWVWRLFFLCFYFIFSRATVSAVLQPCRTCHELFFLLHVVLYVFVANKWWWLTATSWYRNRSRFTDVLAPIAATFADFWCMVWEQNCDRIAMVINLEEGRKVNMTARHCQVWSGCV